MRYVFAVLFLAQSLFGQASGVGNIWSFLGPTTLQSGATANGNGTAMSVAGLSSAAWTVNCSVACSGGTTINFEGSADGTNYVAITAVQVGTATLAQTVLNQGTTITVWESPIGALQSIRARISAYSAGTITITATANAAPWNPQALNSNVFVGGTTVDGNSGNKSAATLRAVIATDQPNLTTPLNDNVAQINGVTPLMGNGATGTGSPRVTLSNDSSAIAVKGEGATGSAVPSGAQYIAGNGTGNLTGIVVCDNFAKLDMTTATTTEIVALSGSTIVYVCQETIVSNGTSTVTRKYGTGTNCGTGTTSSGAAWDLTAQTGVSRGSGVGYIAKTGATGQALCYTSSAAVNVHIEIAYSRF